MDKKVILTGLRANNDLHIGNYFGALLPIIDMAKTKSDEYQVNLFVPDLHSFNTPIDHSQFSESIKNNLITYAAAGLPLDNPNVFLYRQSFVSAHSELTIILNSFTGTGEMSRMTQFKDKSGDLDSDRVSVGLFDYPVLMAADILLYGASYVPVGDDQSQHLEFARDIAIRLNNRFGELFVVPEAVKDQHAFFNKDQGLRIKDLQDPTKKMSKSSEGSRGIIFMSDDPNEAKHKIMSAETDSIGTINYDKDNQPGVSNLLEILSLVSNEPLDQVIDRYKGQPSYGNLKQELADKMASFLANFQEAYKSVDLSALTQKLEDDEAKMRIQANQTLLSVQKAVGLR